MTPYGPSAVSPQERQRLLEKNGPQLNARVLNPMAPQGANELSSNFGPNDFKARALIDTGATMNCIDNGLARRAELLIIDNRPMSSVSSRQMTPVYWAEVRIPKLDKVITGEFYGTNLIYNGQENHMLLGRPFLSQYVFIYDGIEGIFHLELKDAPFQTPIDM